jgi:hypothetical protein
MTIGRKQSRAGQAARRPAPGAKTLDSRQAGRTLGGGSARADCLNFTDSEADSPLRGQIWPRLCAGSPADRNHRHLAPETSLVTRTWLALVLASLVAGSLGCCCCGTEEYGCGNGDWGCGRKYYGEWYTGPQCEPCDCCGNWVGPQDGPSGVSMHGGATVHYGEPTLAEAPPKVPAPKKR